MRISQIAAASKNHVIGTENKLPWHIPEDLKFFREKTLNRICIMGRKTFESIGSKPLPKRMCIVVSRKKDFQAPGCHVFHTVKEALDFAKREAVSSKQWGDEIFILGGAEIYKQMLEMSDRVYLTIIDKEFQGDAFFPELSPNVWELKEKIDHSGPIDFAFCTFDRKK